MQTDEKLVYKGIAIACPQCGRMHDLEKGETYLNCDGELYEVWLRCPTCGLKFDGVSVGKWRRSEAFAELNKVAKNFTNTMNKLSSATKTIYTILLLNEIDHTVTRCFRTPVNVDGLDYILNRLSKTCRPGESYIAIEEAE